MGFTEKQRLVLLAAWRQGHLSDKTNYGTLSDVTGLSRKQISNWARTKINKLKGKAPPKKGDTLLSSIFYELPLGMRTSRDYCTFLVTEVAPKICVKKGNMEPNLTKARFTLQQRRVLVLAWNKGFLCDHKNYKALSEITGLTRKQISNWARTRITKSHKLNLPKKNFAPLSTIFYELIGGLNENSASTSPLVKHEPRHFKQELQYLQGIPSHCDLSPPISSLQYQSLQIATTLPTDSKCAIAHLPAPILSSCSRNHVLTCSSSLSSVQFSNGTAFPQPKNSYEFTHEHSRIKSEQGESTSGIFISPVNQWIIQNALKSTNVVDDQKVEVLAILTCASYNEIIHYLLQHGWTPSPAPHQGIHYVRYESKEVLNSKGIRCKRSSKEVLSNNVCNNTK